MKLISNEEYSLLKRRFDETEKTLLTLKKAQDEWELSQKCIVREKERYENLVKDNQIVLNRKDLELDVKISKEIKDLSNENQKLLLENGNLKQEVSMLNKAFDNMGFDVKDMKEILTKLVEGIIQTHTIQLVK